MKQIACIVLSFLAAVMGACQTPTHAESRVSAQQHWDEVRGRVKLQLAQKEYDSKLFDQAIRSASECITLDPTSADAYSLLARANLDLGHIAAARQAIQTAQEVGLAHPDLIYLEGVILEQEGDTESALLRYSQARQLDATNVDYLVAQAECAVELGRPDIAQRLIDSPGNQCDDDGTVAVLAARVAELSGQADVAAGRYRDAIGTLGSSAMVSRELGLLLVQLERYDEAIVRLQPLLNDITAQPDNGEVRRALATCHLARRNPHAALGVLDTHARSHPEDVRAQLLTAQAAVATGDLLTAMRCVTYAQQHQPDRPEVQLMHAIVQWKREDHAGATATLFDLLVTHPDDVEANCLLAEILGETGQIAAARKHFRMALDIDPTCGWAKQGLRALPDTPEPPPQATVKLTAATISP